MKYIIFTAILLSSSLAFAESYDDPQASYFNQQNEMEAQRERTQMYEQQLRNDAFESQQRETQMQNEYQMQTPAQQFTHQFGDCYTCQ